ncbi:type IV secretion system protein [Bartonella sp. CB178]|uniref:type IV secretion system protein n=1 Tax=Bartonella sp. CB178 TaxID=3112255 RepID=UPI00300E6274
MKKLIVTAVVSVVLGMPNLGMSGGNSLDDIDFNSISRGVHHSYGRPGSWQGDWQRGPTVKGNGMSTSHSSKYAKPSFADTPGFSRGKPNTLDPKASWKSLSTLDGKKSLVLKGPQFIYDTAGQIRVDDKMPELYRKVRREEDYLRKRSLDDARETIDERSQYADIMDKAVSLQIFDYTENRFHQISKLLEEVKGAKDAQSIAALQARLKGTLAIIQNEATKLQMITHLRSIEQALISRLKRKRNVQILYSKNTEMPAIKYNVSLR